MTQMACRICLDPASKSEPFIYPCNCSGHLGNVHRKCLQQWIDIRQSPNCELCKTKYDTTFVSIPCLTKDHSKLLGLIIFGCAVALMLCYSLWILHAFNYISPLLSIGLIFLYTLVQIIIWALSSRQHVHFFIFIPFVWFGLFLMVHFIIMAVSNRWRFNYVLGGAITINGSSCCMMSFASWRLSLRNRQ